MTGASLLNLKVLVVMRVNQTSLCAKLFVEQIKISEDVTCDGHFLPFF